MDTESIVAAYREEGRNLAWGGEILERLPTVTRRTNPNGGRNEVIAFALDSANVGEAIREQVAHFDRLGCSFEWKVASFDSPVDLAQRLEAAGFSVGPLEKVVVYAIEQGLSRLGDDFECEVKKIESEAQLADYRQVVEAAFGSDHASTTQQLAESLRSGHKDHVGYVAYVDGIPAAAGRLYLDPKSAFAGLYGGGTAPQYRGRGCYRAIVAARAKHAVEHGARFLQVDAMPTSLPILLRLGFIPIADTWPCEYTPTANA